MTSAVRACEDNLLFPSAFPMDDVVTDIVHPILCVALGAPNKQICLKKNEAPEQTLCGKYVPTTRFLTTDRLFFLEKSLTHNTDNNTDLLIQSCWPVAYTNRYRFIS